MRNVNLRFQIPGGIVSPGELRKISSAANYFGITQLHFGDRQDLLLKVKKNQIRDLNRRLDNCLYTMVVGKEESSNIITSFAGTPHAPSWVTEGVYLEILSLFTYRPKLKINITDPFQSATPLFSGDLNFVASHHDNYWYLFLNFRTQGITEMWPVLVESNEVPLIAQAIEELWIKNSNLNILQFQNHVYNIRNWNFRIIDKPLTVKPQRFFNYEGFHSMGERYWLGIYHREDSFPTAFIENLCSLCSLTNIGSIILTSWKSLMIKNIDEKDIPLWENLLGKYAIHTGHSQLELNWQISELDEQANKVKKYLYKEFERNGLRTAGLTLGVSSHGGNLPVSILINKKTHLSLFGIIDLYATYSVKYRKDFDANATELIPFADGLNYRNLPNILSYLVSLYYDKLNRISKEPEINYNYSSNQESVSKKHIVYQCNKCLTVYDPAYGDESASINKGTAFENLPKDYCCPVCENGKAGFEPIEIKKLQVK